MSQTPARPDTDQPFGKNQAVMLMKALCRHEFELVFDIPFLGWKLKHEGKTYILPEYPLTHDGVVESIRCIHAGIMPGTKG